MYCDRTPELDFWVLKRFLQNKAVRCEGLSRTQDLTCLLWYNSGLLLRNTASQNISPVDSRLSSHGLDSIEVTPGTVMDHRPHSGPEQCEYCILAYINFLFGLKFKFYDIAYFLCVCYSYNSEKTRTYAEETICRSMGSSTICHFL